MPLRARQQLYVLERTRMIAERLQRPAEGDVRDAPFTPFLHDSIPHRTSIDPVRLIHLAPLAAVLSSYSFLEAPVAHTGRSFQRLLDKYLD
jgi:hypothetical protein